MLVCRALVWGIYGEFVYLFMALVFGHLHKFHSLYNVASSQFALNIGKNVSSVRSFRIGMQEHCKDCRRSESY